MEENNEEQKSNQTEDVNTRVTEATAETKVEAKEISFTLYAKLSKELIPTTGIFFTSAKAFIVAIPILTPVKEPGPIAAS